MALLNNNGADQFKKLLPPWMADNKFLDNLQDMQDKVSIQAKNVRQQSMLPFIRLRSSFKGFK